ncbi:hypothetical protein KHU50_013201 [Colletotrichum sp. SAR 10_65]|nr:hypothetical protein KHU50_013201 [Colletotrichum sp. SAR 10_65]KAI8212178.1 hypothetical protein K4K52_008706 [Colletotrichum sp. SAR 10_76]KAI8226545.1 hypothetical protein K4K53_006073 [Colletotrichum sp. SAR 10_77]
MAPKHDDDAVDIAEHEQAHANEYEIKDLALARQAAEDEHSLGFLEAIRLYPKAALWSVLVSASIIMEGYDIVLISSFFAQPAFREHYGEYIPSKGSYEITAAWQNGLSNAVSVGTIIGAFANGYFTHRFGYRKVLLVSLASICCFIFISFFSPNLPVLLVGQFLCGIPWGVFATTAPAYASEVCPLALRGYLTVYVNLCWALGQLISAGVQAGFSERVGQWSYRVPFAIQWVWPLPLFAILWFAPESPWYFVRLGKYDQAEMSILRLSSPSQRSQAKQKVAMMIHTNEIEAQMDEGTSYMDCFRGVDLRRTEIACLAFAAQPFCGSAMGDAANYGQAGMMLAWLAVYYLTVGPICYAIISEVSSTRLRNKSVCLSRITYYVAQIICNVINPYMLNPTAGGWKGKTAFFWGGCAFVFFIWTYFRLPETKGKTFEELDILFARGVKASDFASYKVDAYAGGEEALTKEG